MLDESRLGRQKTILELIKEKGGLNMSSLRDVTGEEKVQPRWGPGLFSKKGMSLDDLVVRAREEGFLTDADINNPADNGCLNKLSEIIRNELAGQHTTSTQQAGVPEQLPEWYANIKGLKNKPAAINASIEHSPNTWG